MTESGLDLLTLSLMTLFSKLLVPIRSIIVQCMDLTNDRDTAQCMAMRGAQIYNVILPDRLFTIDSMVASLSSNV